MANEAKKRLPLQHLLAQMKGSPFKSMLKIVYPFRRRKSMMKLKIPKELWKKCTAGCSV